MRNYYSQDLTKKVYIAEPVISKNSRGTTVYTYPAATADMIQTRAGIEPYSSMIIKGQALQIDATQIAIILRYRAVSSKARIIYQGHVYEQTQPAIDVDMRHKWLKLTCRELMTNA